MSNRVEELESKVSELQAAVDGLTEELVEAKERVRQLESQVEVGVETSPSGSGTRATRSAEDETTPDVGSEVVDGGPNSAAEGGNSGDGGASSDERKSEQAESSTEESESGSDGSDIIVA